MMVKQFALDPALLVFDSGFERSKILKQLKMIIGLNLALERNIMEAFLPSTITSELQKNGKYPSQSDLEATFSRLGLTQVYSVPDVCRKIDRILSQKSLEHAIELNDLLWEDFVVGESSKSNEFKDTPLSQCFERLIALLMISNHPRNDVAKVVSSKSPGEVGISITVQLTEPENFRDFTYPIKIDGSICLIDSIESAIESIDPVSVWQSAQNANDIKLAIRLQSRRLLKQDGKPHSWSDLPNFYLGEGFVQSLKGWQAYGQGEYSTLVLNVCASVCIRRENIDIGDFFEHDSRNVRRRSSDNASGKRVHVSGAKIGLRLLIWERIDKTFELANIGAKKELYIHVGSPEKAI